MFAVEKRLPCVVCAEPTNFRKRALTGRAKTERIIVVCTSCGERGKA